MLVATMGHRMRFTVGTVLASGCGLDPDPDLATHDAGPRTARLLQHPAVADVSRAMWSFSSKSQVQPPQHPVPDSLHLSLEGTTMRAPRLVRSSTCAGSASCTQKIKGPCLHVALC